MCLDTRFKPEVEKKMLSKLPDGLITVYKVVRLIGSHYCTEFNHGRFRVGLNRVTSQVRLGRGDYVYFSGYHSFCTKVGVYKWRGQHIVKMQIRKEWITAIGKQDGCTVYVTDRIISPSLRDKSAVVV